MKRKDFSNRKARFLLDRRPLLENCGIETWIFYFNKHGALSLFIEVYYGSLNEKESNL